MESRWIMAVLAGALLLTAAPAATAATAERQQTQPAVQQQEQQVYGWQLMTPAERLAYRNRLRAAPSAQEREKIRAEHHEQMKERARRRGVTLPEEPGPWGKGMGPGMGRGMGPRGGR